MGLSRRRSLVLALPLVEALLGVLGPASPARAESAQERFRAANELVRAGDYPRAIAVYGELARSGEESATLYWNWAQAATARGAHGEALWALLRARELDPADRAVVRDVERLRSALNLDPAEIAPEPLAVAGRLARRYRLDLVAAVLLGLSVLAHAAARTRARPAFAAGLAWLLLGLGLLAAASPHLGSLARPTATVVRRGAPLFDAASPSASPAGTLREGEVVPVLESSGDWLRVEDNAGARGWAHQADVRRLDRAPAKS
ncbi:MAG TPA: SH3 domain-containing protein [Gaiellaceae bacterium]|nr:SH3 domain-containing protein [Gaiellaceae bacterium]